MHNTSHLPGRKIAAIHIRRFLILVLVAAITRHLVVPWLRALPLNDYLGISYATSIARNSTHDSRQSTVLEQQSSLLSSNETVAAIATTSQHQADDELPPVVLHFPPLRDHGFERLMTLDGLMGSKAIHLLQGVNESILHPNIVWVGWPAPRRLCNMGMVHQALELVRAQQNHSGSNNNVTDIINWTFHLLDWADNPDGLIRCHELESLVGGDNVHYWKRSIVQGRTWNESSGNIILGKIATEMVGVKVRPLFYATRTDVAQGIEAAVASMTNRTNMTAKELSEYVVTKDRPGDVIHHWPARGGRVDRGASNNPNERLRTRTSVTLNAMKGKYDVADVFCGIFGATKHEGRSSTTTEFVESLLRYKIMVVVQRDFYEGHLRLLEGLVSGALVIHDRMLSIPPGMEENKNIVFYDTFEELEEKVLYYLNHTDERLAIARRGRHLAMCQSRSWHRMEQVILGKTVTPCDESDDEIATTVVGHFQTVVAHSL